MCEKGAPSTNYAITTHTDISMYLPTYLGIDTQNSSPENVAKRLIENQYLTAERRRRRRRQIRDSHESIFQYAIVGAPFSHKF